MKILLLPILALAACGPQQHYKCLEFKDTVQVELEHGPGFNNGTPLLTKRVVPVCVRSIAEDYWP